MIGIAEAKQPAARRILRCNGLSFPVLTWGSPDARPVLVLHGFPQEPSTWRPVAESLAEDGFGVFAPFQRGYIAGTRPQGPDGYTFEKFVADALGIADALRLAQFDVIGFGLGGAQAWMLAAEHPERVRSLTSLRFPHPAAFAHGVQFEPDQRKKWRHLQQQFGAEPLAERAARMLADDASGLRLLLKSNGLPQPFLDRYVARLKQPGALLGALSWEHAMRLDKFLEVPAVTVPTCYLWSEGPALTRTTVEATRGHVQAAFHEELIPDAGNFMLETSAAALIEPLRLHLQRT